MSNGEGNRRVRFGFLRSLLMLAPSFVVGLLWFVSHWYSALLGTGYWKPGVLLRMEPGSIGLRVYWIPKAGQYRGGYIYLKALPRLENVQQNRGKSASRDLWITIRGRYYSDWDFDSVSDFYSSITFPFWMVFFVSFVITILVFVLMKRPIRYPPL